VAPGAAPKPTWRRAGARRSNSAASWRAASAGAAGGRAGDAAGAGDGSDECGVVVWLLGERREPGTASGLGADATGVAAKDWKGVELSSCDAFEDDGLHRSGRAGQGSLVAGRMCG